MIGHIRQRSPGSWELRYRLDTKTITSTWRGDRRSAERELRRLLRLIDTGAHHNDPARLTVAAWLDRWLAMVKPELSPVSYDGYSRIVRNYLRPTIGSIRLAKLSPADVQEMHSGIADRGGMRGKLSASSRALINSILSAALNRAMELELIGRNPCHVIRRRVPRPEKREQAVLDLVAMQAALDTATEPYRLAILIGLATGARRGEICALRWRHLNVSTLSIAEAVTQIGKATRAGPTKTGRTRRIALPDTLVDTLRQVRVQQAEHLLANGVRQSPDHHIVAWPLGIPLKPNTLTEYCRRLFGGLGRPDLHFHSLRHSFATVLLEAGVSPRVAQQQLGHANVSMTLGTYSHVTERLEVDAAQRVDHVLRKLQ